MDANASDLVALVTETLSLYHDSRSCRAVSRFVRTAVKNASFLKALAAAVVKLAPSPPAAGTSAGSSRLSRQQAYSLLCWASLALEQLQAESAKKAVAKLAEVCALLLDVLAARLAVGSGSASPDVNSAPCRPVMKLLRKRKDLLQVWAKCVDSVGGSVGCVEGVRFGEYSLCLAAWDGQANQLALHS